MWKRLVWIGGALLVVLDVWARLAQISPDYFAVGRTTQWIDRVYTHAPSFMTPLMAAVFFYLLWDVSRQRGSASSTSRPVAPLISAAASDGLRVVGKMPDGQIVLVVGNKVVEFDSWAAEYFEARDSTEAARIERAIKAGQKAQYNSHDLQQIVSGKVPDNEPVFPISIGLPGARRVRFWTRTAVAALPEGERNTMLQINAELRLWLRHRLWSETIRLLGEGRDLIPDPLPSPPLSDSLDPKAPDLLGGLLAIAGKNLLTDGPLQQWRQRVNEHLA